MYKSRLCACSKMISSPVSVTISPQVTEFGDIKFFNPSYTLAYIDWYTEYECDPESGLIIMTNSLFLV